MDRKQQDPERKITQVCGLILSENGHATLCKGCVSIFSISANNLAYIGLRDVDPGER